MLIEALNFLFARCEDKFRRFGYLHEAIAINARFRRCKSAWKPHLDRTQAEISTAIDKVCEHSKVVVLGAGAGYDIPLDELERRFDRVILVDVVFLKAMRKRVGKSSRISLVEADLTGLVDILEDVNSNFNIKDIQAKPPAEILKGADLVVSCNVLSQLPISIQNWLIKSGVDENDLNLKECCRQIIKDHLRWLESSDSSVLLITDLERRVVPVKVTEEGEVRDNALYGLKLDNIAETWIWDIAPSPEIDRDYHLKHLVGSVFLSRDETFDVF